MVFDSSFYYQNIRFILSLGYFIAVIIAGADQNKEIIKNSYLLILYGAIGIATPFIQDILFFYFPNAILSAIIVSGVLLIAIFFLLIYAIKNYNLFGRPLLIAAIFLLINYSFNLLFNITISFLDFTSLLSFIGSLVINSILIIPMVFLIIHGRKNEDQYLTLAGLLRIGTFLFVIITELILGISY